MGLTDKLNQYMKDKGISRMQLAKETGIPYTTIVNFYERGTDNVKLSTLKKLADYMNCTLDELVGEETPGETDGTVKIPIVGTISCGNGVIAFEDVEGLQEIPKEWAKGGTYFFLRAKGDSMIGARIHDGDLLLIRRQDTVEDGEIAAVLVNDEAFVKRVFFRNGMLILHSENPNYPPVVYHLNDENVRIIGKLKKIIIDV